VRQFVALPQGRISGRPGACSIKGLMEREVGAEARRPTQSRTGGYSKGPPRKRLIWRARFGSTGGRSATAHGSWDRAPRYRPETSATGRRQNPKRPDAVYKGRPRIGHPPLFANGSVEKTQRTLIGRTFQTGYNWAGGANLGRRASKRKIPDVRARRGFSPDLWCDRPRSANPPSSISMYAPVTAKLRSQGHNSIHSASMRRARCARTQATSRPRPFNAMPPGGLGRRRESEKTTVQT